MADLFISPADLFDCLMQPNAPLIIDLRVPEDAAEDPMRLPTATSLSLADISAGKEPSERCVFVCQKGGKISQVAAGLFRGRGQDAQVLRGGHLAWRAQDLPVIPVAPLEDRWVMPLDPTSDELGALWVLRRLIDRTCPVVPVERSWLQAASDVWEAGILPPSPADLADRASIPAHHIPDLPDLPANLIRGRMARAATPQDALDLIDDCRAGAEAAA